MQVQKCRFSFNEAVTVRAILPRSMGEVTLAYAENLSVKQ